MCPAIAILQPLYRTVLISALLPLVLTAMLAVLVGAEAPPARLFEALGKSNRIDEIVLAKLKEKGLPPSERCTDEVFLRRVSLDATGTLPTAAEARTFLVDRDPAKREKLIDRLLASDAFIDCWTLKWGDLLRVKSEFPSNLWPNGVQAYHRWIHDAIRDGMPYDRFVRELLTASGSNFHIPQVNFWRAFQERAPRQFADNVALLFMGLRLDDAGFTAPQILGFSAFFAKVGFKSTEEWKEEIVFFNPHGVLKDPTGAVIRPIPFGGAPVALAANQDPRVALADWLTAKDNPWFARCIANRMWFWLTGRGIVHEPDDMKPANAPWSPELLTFLAQELVARNYDCRHLFRLILGSRTWQLSAKPNQWNANDDSGFSHYRVRRLDAEPLLDAINQITGGSEKYVSMIPEPFTYLPGDQRAIALADGSIESPFLELFGRPPRNTSFESERTGTSSVFQAQNLLVASHIQKKIQESKPLQQLAAQAQNQATNGPGRVRLLDELYLLILSRMPSETERRIAAAYVLSPKRKPWEGICDLVWAMINSTEFQLRH